MSQKLWSETFLNTATAILAIHYIAALCSGLLMGQETARHFIFEQNFETQHSCSLRYKEFFYPRGFFIIHLFSPNLHIYANQVYRGSYCHGGHIPLVVYQPGIKYSIIYKQVVYIKKSHKMSNLHNYANQGKYAHNQITPRIILFLVSKRTLVQSFRILLKIEVICPIITPLLQW